MLEAEYSPGPSAAERARQLVTFNYLIWSRNRALPVCSIVSQPLCYRAELHVCLIRQTESAYDWVKLN
jgi:hypothetical protein